MKYRVMLEGEYPVDAGKVYVEPARDIDVPIPSEYLYYARTTEHPRCDLNWIPETIYQSGLITYGYGGGFYCYGDYNLYSRKLELKVCRYTEEVLEPYMTDVKLGLAILRELTEEEQELYPNKVELIRHVWVSDFDFLDIPKAGYGWQDVVINMTQSSALYKKGDKYYWVLTMSHYSDDAERRDAIAYSGFYHGVLNADVSDEMGTTKLTSEALLAGGRAWNTITWNKPPAIILRGADGAIFYDNKSIVFKQPNFYATHSDVTLTIPCALYQSRGLKSVTVYMSRQPSATSGEVACALVSYEGFIRRWAVNRIERASLPITTGNYTDMEECTFYFDPPIPPYWWQDDGLSHKYMNDGIMIGSISGGGDIDIAYYCYDFEQSLTMPRGSASADWNFATPSVWANDVALKWERYCL